MMRLSPLIATRPTRRTRWQFRRRVFREAFVLMAFLWALFWLLEIGGVMLHGPHSTGTLWQAAQSEQ